MSNAIWIALAVAVYLVIVSFLVGWFFRHKAKPEQRDFLTVSITWVIALFVTPVIFVLLLIGLILRPFKK